MQEAAEVALNTVIEMMSELEHVKVIRFVLYGKDDFEVHEDVLARID